MTSGDLASPSQPCIDGIPPPPAPQPPPMTYHPHGPITLFSYDLARLPRWHRLVGLSVGVFAAFLLYGYLQELIFSLEGFRPFGWFLTFVQFLCYSTFGVVELFLLSPTEARRRRTPLRIYSLIALLTVTTMACSNVSVAHLNYPTQVIFKSCKLIPVMIGGVFIQGKTYGLIDVSAALLMTVGLVFFTLTDVSLHPNFDPTGVFLVSVALMADAVIGNVQEKAMKAHSSSTAEMVLYSYSIGAVYLFVGLLIKGDLLDALTFCAAHPGPTLGYALLFSLAGYLGVNVVLALVASHGALVAVTVTTLRKSVTILLSFLFFAKPFSPRYAWSGFLVLAGIYLNVANKNHPRVFVDAFHAAANRTLRAAWRWKRRGGGRMEEGLEYV